MLFVVIGYFISITLLLSFKFYLWDFGGRVLGPDSTAKVKRVK